MNDTLYSDLVKIEEWGVQIEWNLMHAKPNAVCYRTSEHPILAKTFIWVVWQFAKSETLDVLGTSIRSKEAAKCFHIYGQVRLNAHLILWIVYKVER